MDTGQFLPRADGERTTVTAVFERYAREALPQKESRGQISSSFSRITEWWGLHSLVGLTPGPVARIGIGGFRQFPETKWARSCGLFGRIYRIAMTDWGIYVPRGAPADRIWLPPTGRGRDRRVPDAELDATLAATRSRDRTSLLRVAVETAVRRGELTALTLKHFDLCRRVVHLPESRNGQARDVPLSKRAREERTAIPRRPAGREWGLTPDAACRSFVRTVQTAQARHVESEEVAGASWLPIGWSACARTTCGTRRPHVCSREAYRSLRSPPSLGTPVPPGCVSMRIVARTTWWHGSESYHGGCRVM
ncbi:tyrosine-type recombinase/integrase [Thioalkalivibrio sp. ALE9]|uniref:tyrosine-type recombinase/integrase n=1 Tax=Thioalkalivibrio sp. ALE9 TaxID=1158169 RepID=UPI00350F810E